MISILSQPNQPLTRGQSTLLGSSSGELSNPGGPARGLGRGHEVVDKISVETYLISKSTRPLSYLTFNTSKKYTFSIKLYIHMAMLKSHYYRNTQYEIHAGSRKVTLISIWLGTDLKTKKKLTKTKWDSRTRLRQMNESVPREKGVFTRRKCWWSGSDHPGPAQDAVHLVSHLPGFALKLLLKVILTWSGPSTHSYHSPDCALPIAYPYRLSVATPPASCSNHTLPLPHMVVCEHPFGTLRWS